MAHGEETRFFPSKVGDEDALCKIFNEKCDIREYVVRNPLPTIGLSDKVFDGYPPSIRVQFTEVYGAFLDRLLRVQIEGPEDFPHIEAATRWSRAKKCRLFVGVV